MTGDAMAAEHASAELAVELIETLAGEIGARRPTSRAEALAAELIADRLRAHGAEPAVEPFPAYASFAYPYGVIAAFALLPAALPERWGAVRALIGLKAAAHLAWEGELRHAPLSALLARAESRNVSATIEPSGEPARTLCLMAHADTSRSGLLFHPLLAPYLQQWITAQSIATAGLAAAPLLDRTRAGRAVTRIARATVATGLALLAERELRGVDVPGANDNASGAGAVVQLAAETVAAPLDSTRLVVLVTGSEEAGVLGARAFLDAHDTSDWLFLNFDGVGAPATLRYLPAEGIVKRWDADPGLLELARRIERDHSELELGAVDRPTGLTYDATAVLARGGRALTLVAGDGGRIPNYHQPTDTVENLDRERLANAIAVGRELIAMIDRGEADAR
jgi:hypothetical protein